MLHLLHEDNNNKSTTTATTTPFDTRISSRFLIKKQLRPGTAFISSLLRSCLMNERRPIPHATHTHKSLVKTKKDDPESHSGI
jgi:hypothetical protein